MSLYMKKPSQVISETVLLRARQCKSDSRNQSQQCTEMEKDFFTCRFNFH